MNVEVMSMVASAARFRVTISEAETVAQYGRKVKLLSQLSSKTCTSANEEEMEDWVDEAACVVTRFQVCVGIYQEAWSLVVHKQWARKIAPIPLRSLCQ